MQSYNPFIFINNNEILNKYEMIIKKCILLPSEYKYY
jgi:hypothetical protein